MNISNIHQCITKVDFLDKITNGNAFVEPKKGDGEIAASLQISEEAQKRFDEAIQHFDRRVDLPEYCGVYKTDKAIATAVEDCSKEERLFVYDAIRQNFLLDNTSSLTEEERQANIALGLKKMQYAAENFIPEEHREKFLEAMNTVAKLASAGKADNNGNMNYGVTKPSYLGHGSNLVATTNTLDMMKTMDSAAYQEYQRIGEESSNEDRALNRLKYLTNWYNHIIKYQPKMLEEYESKTEEYMKNNIENRDLKVPSYFDRFDISSKETFLNELRNFMSQHPNFMTGIFNVELTNRYWND